MEFKNKIFAILAIFCLIVSACAVSAADTATDNTEELDAQQVHDEMMLPPDYAHSEMDSNNGTGQAAGTNDTEELDAQAVHDGMMLPPDYAHSEMDLYNGTGHAAGDNTTGHAAGENATVSNTMPATGNPILLLLAVGAVLGGAFTLRRK